METTPLFLGLVKPPRFMGIPLTYWLVIAISAAIILILTNALYAALYAVAVYIPVLFVSDRHPYFFNVVATVEIKTRRTPNRRIYGGDFYDV